MFVERVDAHGRIVANVIVGVEDLRVTMSLLGSRAYV